MLVIHPNSTCDVCLEGYSNGQNTPHAIVCGHSFCQGCLESLTRLTCPLCRTRFELQDVRKLHIDRGQTPRVTPSSVTDVIERSTSDDEAQRLQNDIARIVKEGAKVSELRRLLDDCRSWYKNQPPDQYDSLRVSFLLLYHLTETQKKLSAESDKVREAQASCEAWQTARDQLTKELEDADRKHQDLLRQCQDEKETALAVEKSLREHYEQLDAQWKSRYDNAVLECNHLREELRRVRYGHGPISEQPRPIEVRQFYITDKPHKASSNDDLAMAKSDSFDSLIDDKERLSSKEAMFHLSPVPDILSPLPSAIQGFCALAEDDDDEILKAKMKLAKIEADDLDYNYPAKEKPMPYPLPQPRSTVPIPIPSPFDSHSSRQPSGLSIRMARDSDVAAREPGLSRSVSPEKASKSSSRSVSPSSRPVQIRHKSSSVYESKSKDQIATRQILGHGNDDQSNNERWKAKLYDILDSPATSSSLHSNMSSRSDQFIEPLPTHLISRPSSSNSRSHTPPKLPLAAQHSSSSLSVHMDASTHRPPSVSHASKAAWQLENEKRERERERERERLRQAPSNPSSLKDTTMVYSSTGEYRQRHGSGKGNVAKAHGV